MPARTVEQFTKDTFEDETFQAALFHFVLGHLYTEDNIDPEILDIHRQASQPVLNACAIGLEEDVFANVHELREWFYQELMKRKVSNKNGSQIELNLQEVDRLSGRIQIYLLTGAIFN